MSETQNNAHELMVLTQIMDLLNERRKIVNVLVLIEKQATLKPWTISNKTCETINMYLKKIDVIKENVVKLVTENPHYLPEPLTKEEVMDIMSDVKLSDERRAFIFEKLNEAKTKTNEIVI